MVKRKAVYLLAKLGLAKNTVEGPIILSGVGDHKSVTDHGRFQITLPLHNGKNVELNGICLDKLTSTFPEIPLLAAEEDIKKDAVLAKISKPLPKLPKSVGGDIDIMIGALYNRFIPNQVHKMENGLAIYESLFSGEDGSRGVLLGPHKSFTLPGDVSNHVTSFYFSDAFLTYRKQCEMGLSYGLLGAPKEMTNFDLDELAPSGSDLFANEDATGSKNFNNDHSKNYEQLLIKETDDDLTKKIPMNFAPNPRLMTFLG